MNRLGQEVSPFSPNWGSKSPVETNGTLHSRQSVKFRLAKCLNGPKCCKILTIRPDVKCDESVPIFDKFENRGAVELC